MHEGKVGKTEIAPAALKASLPLPPGVNNLYVSANGRRVLSREGKRFKAQVAERLDAMRHSDELSAATMSALRSGYLSLFIDFYFSTPMRRDLDGGLKITQ